MKSAKSTLPFHDALRVRKAEAWLRRGRPTRALRELQRLGTWAWNHPSTEKVIWQTAQAMA